MHILFLCDEYPPDPHGGVGSYTQTLATALVGRDHQVTVVGLYPRDRAGLCSDRGVKVIRVPKSGIARTGFLVNGARIRHAIRELNEHTPVDVIEGPNSALALLSSRIRIPKVMRFHGGHRFFAYSVGRCPQRWRAWLESRSVRVADHLCAVSRYNAALNRRLLGLANRPIEVIPNPVDTRRFAPGPPSSVERGHLLFLGTLSEKKGVRQLLQAAQIVLKRVPHAALHLHGRDWIDPRTRRSMRCELEASLAHEERCRVHFHPAVDHSEVPRILERAELCVAPSLMEAHPIAWLEMMAAGKALVASTTGPGPEVIEDGVSGLLCNPYDVTALADAILRIMQSEALARQLGACARMRAEALYSVDRIAPLNEAYFRQCAEQGVSHGSRRVQ